MVEAVIAHLKMRNLIIPRHNDITQRLRLANNSKRFQQNTKEREGSREKGKHKEIREGIRKNGDKRGKEKAK